jgi:anti-sigma-K factor RskA
MRTSTLTSSAQCAARALRSQTLRSAHGRRTLSTTAARRSDQQGGQGSGQESTQRGWDTRTVLAVAAVAGTAGWAFANTNREKPLGAAFLPKSATFALFGGKDSHGSQPEYGSKAEMEAVCSGDRQLDSRRK